MKKKNLVWTFCTNQALSNNARAQQSVTQYYLDFGLKKSKSSCRHRQPLLSLLTFGAKSFLKKVYTILPKYKAGIGPSLCKLTVCYY